MHRRKFLKRGAVLVAAGLGVPALMAETARVLQQGAPALPGFVPPLGPFGVAAATRSPTNFSRRILVVLQLAGGNDGLNTVVPYGDPLYTQARPTLAIPPDQLLPLDGKVGLSPHLKQLKARYNAGHVAVVQGVGYPNPNRSHFRAMDIWQSAVPERVEPTGWLGRYLNACSCGLENHLEALEMG